MRLGSPAETEGTPVTKVKRSYPNKYPEVGIPMLRVNMAAKNIQCGSMRKNKESHGHEQYTVDPCRKVKCMTN